MPTPQTQKLHELQTIFNALPDGVITIAVDGGLKIININAAAGRILGRDVSAVIHEPVDAVFTANFTPFRQVIQETYAQERPIRNFSVEIDFGEGTKKIFLTNTALVDEEDGTRLIILNLHDISEATQIRKQERHPDQFEALVGTTPAMKEVFSLIDTVAATDSPVLIYGETGTGKELVARAIHERSNRADEPFMPVHCSALTSSLLESDLFGHVKGAFTGAIREKPGRFEVADGGTVFLDEIATLTQEIQVKLLRALQEKTIERVGDTKSRSVDVRIISATNRRLPELMQKGLFRNDLYYRIKVLQINLPPLRKRKPDIPVLIDYFINKFNRKHGRNILGISSEARDLLVNYPWPGNVRELENAIEHAVIISQSNIVEPWDLPEEIENTRQNILLAAHREEGPASDEARIRAALQRSGGNITRAADLLGIHRTTLWRKMRQLNIPKLPETPAP